MTDTEPLDPDVPMSPERIRALSQDLLLAALQAERYRLRALVHEALLQLRPRAESWDDVRAWVARADAALAPHGCGAKKAP